MTAPGRIVRSMGGNFGTDKTLYEIMVGEKDYDNAMRILTALKQTEFTLKSNRGKAILNDLDQEKIACGFDIRIISARTNREEYEMQKNADKDET